MPAIFAKTFPFSFFIGCLNNKSNYTYDRYYQNNEHQDHILTF